MIENGEGIDLHGPYRDLPAPFQSMDPGDEVGWLAVADWLEEHDQPQRAELVRLTHAGGDEVRIRELLAAGVEPCLATVTVGLGHGADMKFAFIPPGTFVMGSPPNEPERDDDEVQHRVTLTKGYFLGIYPVTQAQWQAVMGTNPSEFKGGDLPVENVSWDDCGQFCEKLGEKTGKRFRLPTEAEWEYACRAGTTTPFSFGETISTDQANYNGNSTYGNGKEGEYRKTSTAVSKFSANAWGMHDMHGNVWEWCQDWYDDNYYRTSDNKDPQGPPSGTSRVLRGGSWYGLPECCRAAARDWFGPGARDDYCGFRVCFAWTD
jgi:eukaryotic-like serine/threonine-protein kinase